MPRKHPEVDEPFFERLVDLVTNPDTARLFDKVDRHKVETHSKLPRTELFRGAFHAACDDLRVPREEREEIEDRFFVPRSP